MVAVVGLCGWISMVCGDLLGWVYGGSSWVCADRHGFSPPWVLLLLLSLMLLLLPSWVLLVVGFGCGLGLLVWVLI